MATGATGHGGREADRPRGAVRPPAARAGRPSYLLALSTPGRVGGVALLEGDTLVAEVVVGLASAHARALLPAVDQVLNLAGAAGSDLAGIAVTVGPGSYTGLRIGVTTAKALAYVWGVPLVGVDTLAALAWQVSPYPGRICALLDARHGEVCARLFAGDGSTPLAEAMTGPRERLIHLLGEGAGPVLFAGEGLDPHWEALRQALGERAARPHPALDGLRPATVGSLGRRQLEAGETATPLELVPRYGRRTEAERKWLQSESPTGS